MANRGVRFLLRIFCFLRRYIAAMVNHRPKQEVAEKSRCGRSGNATEKIRGTDLSRQAAYELILDALQTKIIPLENFIQIFAASLGEPSMIKTELYQGFRYEKPEIPHFCLMKLVRAVSGLNAIIALARRGYVQEAMALLRSILEFTREVEAMLPIKERPDEHKTVLENYLRKYLSDSVRGTSADYKKAEISSGTITEILTADLDRVAIAHGEVPQPGVTEARYKFSLQVLHPYIHAKYPEVMELFGGRPGRFHLQGMLGTPKEQEILSFIEMYIETVSITVQLMIAQLNLYHLVQSDQFLSAWYAQRENLGGG